MHYVTSDIGDLVTIQEYEKCELVFHNFTKMDVSDPHFLIESGSVALVIDKYVPPRPTYFEKIKLLCNNGQTGWIYADYVDKI